MSGLSTIINIATSGVLAQQTAIAATAENIAKLIYKQAVSEKFPVVEVRLWETPKAFATYKE